MSRREVYARIHSWYRANIDRVLGDGNCIEIEHDGRRLILDIGSPLDPPPGATPETLMRLTAALTGGFVDLKRLADGEPLILT